MTFGILRANAFSGGLETAKLTQGFVFYGYFYDHKKRTEGFVYREEDLLVFVDKYKKDPPDTDGIVLPHNWSDDFSAAFHEKTARAFRARHRFGEGHIIHDNYDRFKVYYKE